MKNYEFDLFLESYLRFKDLTNEERKFSGNERRERQEGLFYSILQHDSEVYRYETYREKEYKRIYNKETKPHPKFLYCKCSYAEVIKLKIEERKKMTPEEKDRIKEMPEISKTDERLIFIRRQGYNDFQKRIFDLSAIGNSIPVSPLKDLTREQIMDHINDLTAYVKNIKSYIQGHESAFTDEIEPELREKHRREKEEKEKVKKEKSENSNPLTMLEKLGYDKKDVLAKLLALKMQNQK